MIDVFSEAGEGPRSLFYKKKYCNFMEKAKENSRLTIIFGKMCMILRNVCTKENVPVNGPCYIKRLAHTHT